jgi:PAS domain S-box-containing protein
MFKIKDEHKVYIITAVAVILIWVMNAAYDSFIAPEGSFPRLLVNVSRHEFFLRVLLTLDFLAFGIIILRILSKHNRAEAALKKQSAAIESSMDGIAIYNRDGEYVYANQAYALINGYANAAELMGKTVNNAYDETELVRMEQVYMPMLQKNGRWRGELVANEERRRYFQGRGNPAGTVAGVHHPRYNLAQTERTAAPFRTFLNMIFDNIRDPFCH